MSDSRSPAGVEPAGSQPTTPRPEPFQRVFAPAARLIDPFRPAHPPQPPADLMRFIAWSLKDVRGPVALLALCTFAFGAAEAALYAMVGQLVDRAAAAGPDAFLAEEWPFLMFVAALVVLLKPAAQLGQSAMTSLVVGPGLAPLSVWRLHRHTLGQSMRFFEEDFTGRIAQKIQQTSFAVVTVTVDTLTSLGLLIAYVATMAALLMSAEPALGLIVAAWIAGFAAALAWGVPRVRARSAARAAARATVTGQLVDSLSHMKTVKLFAHAEREEAAARQALSAYRGRALDFGHTMMAMRVFIAALNIVVMSAMIGTALWQWIAGSASLGVVAMAAMMTLRLTAMANWISQAALSIFAELGTIEDGAKTLSPAHEVVDRPGAVDPAPVTGRITFDDVTFRYGRTAGGVTSLNLDIRPSEKVGLVGRSGAGKSTTVGLLLRLHDVEAGAVRLDGHDVRDLTQDGLRRAVATVTQETAIFNRSALDNVLYGRPDAGETAAIAAAKNARAHDFIKDLRDGRGREGYAAHLGERGVKLSGGQRQRIALARAILKDAPVLVLDEATSALDSEVEADIQAALTAVMADKTVLAIAHRLSTIAAMDRIVVMDEGRVVEDGPHEVLVAKGGLYAELWSRQSGGFLVPIAAE